MKRIIHLEQVDLSQVYKATSTFRSQYSYQLMQKCIFTKSNTLEYHSNNPRGYLEQVGKYELFSYSITCFHNFPSFTLSRCTTLSCCFYSCCSNFNEDDQCLLCLFKKQIRTQKLQCPTTLIEQTQLY